MNFLESPKGHATISSQTFSFSFQDALPTKTNIVRLNVTLSDKVCSIIFGELSCIAMRKVGGCKGFEKKLEFKVCQNLKGYHS
jgi:hypothetical protein